MVAQLISYLAKEPVMQTQKIVLISHPIRGALHSATRRENIRAIWRILDEVRAQREVVPMAPYLLHAQCAENIVDARRHCVGWHLNQPEELWAYGDELCCGMRSEIMCARIRQLPVFFKSDELVLSLSAPKEYAIAAE